MATYSIPLSSPVGTLIFVDTASSTTPVQVASGSGTIYSITGNNSTNSGACFPKLWDSAGTPTLGVTAPNLQIKCRGTKEDGISYGASGWGFTNGLWLATTTDAGTAGTSAPTNNVIVMVHI